MNWLRRLICRQRSIPMQPVVMVDGVARFKENRIVGRLLENSRQHGYGLNEAAMGDYTDEERMQLAQLIGYSVSGYGSLSYVTDESYEAAAALAARVAPPPSPLDSHQEKP